MKMKILGLTLAAAVGISAATTASAGLDLRSLSASWVNAVGGNVTSNVSGDPASIRWGSTGSASQSGYDFDILSTGGQVPFPSAEIDDIFDLGNFTHFNQPITAGTAITSVDLNITGDIFLDNALAAANVLFQFSFAHNETPNNANPCELGDTIPCGDGVTVSLLDASDTFSVGGIDYTLDILGFVQGGSVQNFFFSDEGNDNSALVKGVFTAAVPEPSVIALVGLGLVGLGFARSRRKVQA